MQVGKFVYVMGPSGSGKDTLLSFARVRLTDQPVVFAHRYITRPVVGAGEIHVPLTDEEFALRLERGLFALHWDSHGLRYGIGREIDHWRAHGLTVVVNGSRAALTEALVRYPDLCPVLITASPETLRRRLEARGRETGVALKERLASAATAAAIVAPNLACIDNDGRIEDGGLRLLELLRGTLA
ncbi:phosphonate metabolism protein/1,5-bisphosphokinase (PRPP-forming) PhnN [Telmatospirillum sp.]|uniref:phosphonate metabolism protein/1,5-bisphosphokinase (PRPP-forming) PhnN n=1 Tax=Telmatospirillum sp. TaxID=2079197 RepID=UPI0028460315|nr:phosphonate metabolism protein/1,5-bisphosphokinase (PRPP-forming) PhnN [Telmatospirillum sp.]MDR3440885.1 phosphonate metabolism protein/1,5-bisphosphokinase (PRPP-forming) PhnN [Telmatospirillum sp.]